jgi:hypothetical protein
MCVLLLLLRRRRRRRRLQNQPCPNRGSRKVMSDQVQRGYRKFTFFTEFWFQIATLLKPLGVCQNLSGREAWET